MLQRGIRANTVAGMAMKKVAILRLSDTLPTGAHEDEDEDEVAEAAGAHVAAGLQLVEDVEPDVRLPMPPQPRLTPIRQQQWIKTAQQKLLKLVYRD